MFAIERTFTFSAAHRLPRHDGKCVGNHGHNFACTLRLESPAVNANGPKTGMVFDFHDIDRIVKPLLADSLDHRDLNASTGLESPTSELLAKWLYDKLKPALPLLACVRVSETPTVCAEYRP